ncbi:hypothetical protein [Micromonospora sp. DT227]
MPNVSFARSTGISNGWAMVQLVDDDAEADDLGRAERLGQDI